MRYGHIICNCGKEFTFESINDTTKCIDCNLIHDISNYPIKEEIEAPVEEGDLDGIDI